MQPTLRLDLGTACDGGTVGRRDDHGQHADDSVEAAADDERERAEQPVEADPVDRRAGRSEPRELEHDDLCDRCEQHRPARPQDQPGAEADNDSDDQERERLSGGDRTARHCHADTEAAQSRDCRDGDEPLPRPRVCHHLPEPLTGVGETSTRRESREVVDVCVGHCQPHFGSKCSIGPPLCAGRNETNGRLTHEVPHRGIGAEIAPAEDRGEEAQSPGMAVPELDSDGDGLVL